MEISSIFFDCVNTFLQSQEDFEYTESVLVLVTLSDGFYVGKTIKYSDSET